MNSAMFLRVRMMRRVLSLLLVIYTIASSTWLPLIAPAQRRTHVIPPAYRLTLQDQAFLEDLSHRSFKYFWHGVDHRATLPLTARSFLARRAAL